MTYRNDLDAAHARNAALEAQLADAKNEIEQLSRRHEQDATERHEDHDRDRPSGRVHFDRPTTYFPLPSLCIRSVRVAWRVRPRAPSRPASNTLVVWAGYYLLLPLVYCLWIPLQLISLVAILVPVLVVLSIVGSVVLLPIIVLSRLTIGPRKERAREPSWLNGNATDKQAALFLWILMSVCMQPLLLFYFSLLTFSES